MKSKNADLSTRVKIFFKKTMKYDFGAQCPTQNMFGAQRPTQNNCGAQRPRRAEALRTKNFGAQRLTLVRNARPPFIIRMFQKIRNKFELKHCLIV